MALSEDEDTENSSDKLIISVYKDLARPGVRQLGKALGTVLELSNVALLPVKLFSEKRKAQFAKDLEDCRKSIANVPEDKVIEVAPEIGVPILNNLSKTGNEKVRILYLNLLANASSIDFVSSTHPRFVSIIESLTHDEVIILDKFGKGFLIPYVTVKATNSGPLPTEHTVIKRATSFEINNTLLLPDKSRFYFENLETLGLIFADERPLYSGEYDDILTHLRHLLNPADFNQYFRRTAIKGFFERTELGKLFLEACEPQTTRS